MAIYLKNFGIRLITQVDKVVSKVITAWNHGEQANVQTIMQTSEGGFTSMQQITSLFVRCCLDNICEQRFKFQLIQIIQKQLLCFQKLATIQPNLLASMLQDIEPRVSAAMTDSSKV